MEFIDIQRRLVDALLSIPATETFAGRSSLLDGLPRVGLTRSETSARVDLNSLVGGLERLGRLDGQGGTRPLVVVVENALTYVTSGSEMADRLAEIGSDLEQYYGGDLQPTLDTTEEELEQLVFGAQRDARLPMDFLVGALRTGRSVARLAVSRVLNGQSDGRVVFGTGWIVAPGVMVTNHHVIQARDERPRPAGWGEPGASSSDLHAQVAGMVARFDYYAEGSEKYIECHGGRLMTYSAELDYAVIELLEAEKVADREPLPVISTPSTLTLGSRLNIAQCPQGGPLRFAIRNNFYVGSGGSERLVRYQTDTEPGASGSPVCDDRWNVQALHRASVSVARQVVPQEVIVGQPVSVAVLNEAVTLAAIVADLPSGIRSKVVGP